MRIETRTAEGCKCSLCDQPIEGEIILEPLPWREETRAFPYAVGLKCRTCEAFLCKACYLDAGSKLKGLKKLSGMGPDCPECGFQFYHPRLNLGVYPLDVDLNKLKEFDDLLQDLSRQGLGCADDPLENGLERIKQHERHLALHLKALSESRDKKGELETEFLRTVVVLGRSGADWLLRREAISDEVVEKIIEKFRTNPKKEVLAASALIEIEVARKDGLLVPEIIEAEKNFAAHSWRMIRITWDERILDCIIEELDSPWESVDMNKSKWYAQAFAPGASQFTAKLLLALGNERGIRAIIQRVLREMQSRQGTMRGYDLVIEWCKEHGSTIAPFLADALQDENPRFRYFALQTLARMDDYNLEANLTDLVDDPDEDVRRLANSIAQRYR